MSDRRRSLALRLALVLPLVLAAAPVLSAEEWTGTAVLAHPCGQLSVEHMALVHEGRFAEAVKLATEEMQTEWAALPDEERQMISEMLQELSMDRSTYEKAIDEHGTLEVDDGRATLTILFVEESSQGTSRQTITQRFEIDGESCRISR